MEELPRLEELLYLDEPLAEVEAEEELDTAEELRAAAELDDAAGDVGEDVFILIDELIGEAVVAIDDDMLLNDVELHMPYMGSQTPAPQ